MTARQSATRPPRSTTSRRARRRSAAAALGATTSTTDTQQSLNASSTSEDVSTSRTALRHTCSSSTQTIQNAHTQSVPSFLLSLVDPAQGNDHSTPDLNDAWDVATKRRGVYNLFQVPARLERLLTLGQFICMDEFLTVFTTLPLRVLLAVLRAMLYLASVPLSFFRQRKTPAAVQKRVSGVIDILHASLLVFTAIALHALDISWVYHNIRGQSVIKLYVVFNVIEIFDRLCSSFGVDIFDSLGWTTASAVAFFARPASRSFGSDTRSIARARALQGFVLLTRVAFDYIFTLVYVVLHAFLLLTWVVTLNVAINTQNNALLTLLVSNNFVELKGAVFKSFKVQNLFQISCSDAVERFQLNIFLAVMVVVTRGDRRLFTTWAIIYACEVIVDWIKHAFVTKFNRISHRVYHQFSLVISDDIVKARKNSIVRSIGGSAVSKRVGFVSLPLAALVIRMMFTPVMSLPTAARVVIFVSLLLFKIAVSIGLIGHAHRKLTSVTSGGSVEVGDDEDRDKDIYWHQKLLNVERYDLFSKS